MIPSFPLNVFRDRKVEIPDNNVPPHKTVAEVVEGERKPPVKPLSRAVTITSRTRIKDRRIWRTGRSPARASFSPRWECAKV